MIIFRLSFNDIFLFKNQELKVILNPDYVFSSDEIPNTVVKFFDLKSLTLELLGKKSIILNTLITDTLNI